MLALTVSLAAAATAWRLTRRVTDSSSPEDWEADDVVAIYVSDPEDRFGARRSVGQHRLDPEEEFAVLLALGLMTDS